MKKERIRRLLTAQRTCFDAGETLPLAFRLQALRQLREGIIAMEGEFHAALREDLGKSETESHLTEISMVQADIRYYQNHLNRLAKVNAVPMAPSQFPATGEVIPCPKGNVLVIAPWNYPFLLALAPAVAALAAGNTVILKPSEFAPATARVMHRLFSQYLPSRLCALIPGGVEDTQFLLSHPFDHIFFTGGTEVGRMVMQRAAEHLTPVTLELGGKSPCIVDEDAIIPFAAKRIVFGKFLNCGQTCVAPDYILVHESVHIALLAALKKEVIRQYGEALENPDYGHIINRRHFDRLQALLADGEVICGGGFNEETLQIEPTILDGVQPEDAVMQGEIFGPILPVLVYKDLNEACAFIAARPHPLALYFFGESAEKQRRVMQRVQFGGGCVNDTVIHLCSPYLPFGGVGASGMGSYHGKAGFDTFTHYKSVLYQPTQVDLPLRYPPYTPEKSKILRRLIR